MATAHWQIIIDGHVQGVGFRPFVWQQALAQKISGSVQNVGGRVYIKATGLVNDLESFCEQIQNNLPTNAKIDLIEIQKTTTADQPMNFTIEPSAIERTNVSGVALDLAPCGFCKRDFNNVHSRRYRHYFTACTSCGPRYAGLKRLPYDRQNSSWQKFAKCEQCQIEYVDNESRFFHAQPINCPHCGPQLDGDVNDIILALQSHEVVAVQGLSGFHLMAKAHSFSGVEKLRLLKKRSHKPFALLFSEISQVEEYCYASPFEITLLESARRPIVLLTRRPGKSWPDNLFFENEKIAVFLPVTFLQHEIVQRVGPLIATSANVSDDVLCANVIELQKRLANFRGHSISHDLEILHPSDDSLCQTLDQKIHFIRRGRGYAPFEVQLPFKLTQPTLAVGGHFKNTIALGQGDRAFISPHVGDLSSPSAVAFFHETIETMQGLYQIKPELVVCDSHPGYASSQWAHCCGLPVKMVGHHHAHAMSLMIENQIKNQLLVATFDGMGMGADSTIWGAEFLQARYTGFERVGGFKQFKQIGGDKAARSPALIALAILFELYGHGAVAMTEIPCVQEYKKSELENLFHAWQRNINTNQVSSMGRLFDALASFLSLHQQTSFEAQAAMAIEQKFDFQVVDKYELKVEQGEVSWLPMFVTIIADLVDRQKRVIVSKFMNAIAQVVIDMAKLKGQNMIGLSGGVFQNLALVQRIFELGRVNNIKVLTHTQVPCNDAGLSLGQLAAGQKGIGE